jgi:hypothetical protein
MNEYIFTSQTNACANQCRPNGNLNGKVTTAIKAATPAPRAIPEAADGCPVYVNGLGQESPRHNAIIRLFYEQPWRRMIAAQAIQEALGKDLAMSQKVYGYQAVRQLAARGFLETSRAGGRTLYRIAAKYRGVSSSSPATRATPTTDHDASLVRQIEALRSDLDQIKCALDTLTKLWS